MPTLSLASHWLYAGSPPLLLGQGQRERKTPEWVGRESGLLHRVFGRLSHLLWVDLPKCLLLDHSTALSFSCLSKEIGMLLLSQACCKDWTICVKCLAQCLAYSTYWCCLFWLERHSRLPRTFLVLALKVSYGKIPEFWQTRQLVTLFFILSSQLSKWKHNTTISCPHLFDSQTNILLYFSNQNHKHL